VSEIVNFSDLKVSKLMAKCGLKTLCISIYGGNITMAMGNSFNHRLDSTFDHRRCEGQVEPTMKNKESRKCIFVF